MFLIYIFYFSLDCLSCFQETASVLRLIFSQIKIADNFFPQFPMLLPPSPGLSIACVSTRSKGDCFPYRSVKGAKNLVTEQSQPHHTFLYICVQWLQGSLSAHRSSFHSSCQMAVEVSRGLLAPGSFLFELRTGARITVFPDVLGWVGLVEPSRES